MSPYGGKSVCIGINWVLETKDCSLSRISPCTKKFVFDMLFAGNDSRFALWIQP